MRQISVQMTGALRHQRFRYEDMGFQEGQGGSREAAGPAVNVMMFHEAIRLGDVVGEFHVLTSGPTEDLFFSIYPSIAGENVRLSFEANPHLYSERDLAMHHRQFVRLLEGFLDSATRALGDLRILSTDEVKDLVPALGPRTDGFATLDSVIRGGAGRGVLSRSVSKVWTSLTTSSALARMHSAPCSWRTESDEVTSSGSSPGARPIP